MADDGVGSVAALLKWSCPPRPRISMILIVLEPMSMLRYDSSPRIGLSSEREAVSRRPARLAQLPPTAMYDPTPTASSPRSPLALPQGLTGFRGEYAVPCRCCQQRLVHAHPLLLTAAPCR